MTLPDTQTTTPPASRRLTKPKKVGAAPAPVVVQLDPQRYAVASASAPGSWQYVLLLGDGLLCACLGFEHLSRCRHATAVRAVLDGAAPAHPLPRWPGVFR